MLTRTQKYCFIWEPEEIPPLHVLLYPPLPPTLPVAKALLEADTSPKSSPSHDLPIMLSVVASPKPPMLTLYSLLGRQPKSWARRDCPFLPWFQGALWMPLRETRGAIYFDQEGQIWGGQCVFVYQPFATTDLLNWKKSYSLLHWKAPGYEWPNAVHHSNPQAYLDWLPSASPDSV